MAAKLKAFCQWLLSSFLAKLVLFFTVFFLLIQLVNFQLYKVLETSYVDGLVASYNNQATAVVSNVSRIFFNLYQTNYMLSMDQTVQNIFSSYYSISHISDYAQIPQVTRQLARIKMFNDYMVNATFYKRDSNMIISDYASYPADGYYNTFHTYDLYDKAFWDSYHRQDIQYEILLPCEITSIESPTPVKVLPIVQSRIFSFPSDNLYIIDLNVEMFSNLLDGYKSTENSLIFILNREGQQLLSSNLPDELDSAALLADISENATHGDSIWLNGGEQLVLRYSTTIFSEDVQLVTCIPYSDITGLFQNSSATRLAVLIFLFLLSGVLIYFFSTKAYAPIKGLVSFVSPNRAAPQATKRFTSNKSEFDYIREAYHSIMGTLKNTESALSHVACLAEEQLLSRVMIGQSLSEEELTRFNEMFAGAAPRSFMVVALRSCMRKRIYADFSDQFLYEFMPRFKAVVGSVFAPASKHLIELSPNHLAVVFHGADAFTEAMARESASRLLELIREDKDYFSVYIAVSGVFQGEAGLRQAYAQASSALSKASPFLESQMFEPQAAAAATGFTVSPGSENKIENLIATGKREEVHGLIADLLNSEQVKNLTLDGIQQLVTQLYFIAVRVLKKHEKSLSLATENRFADFNIRLREMSQEQIADFLQEFFLDVADVYSLSAEPLSLQLFKDYIDQHFNEDLSLESLAKKYNTSPTYISRLLKKELNVPFQSYIISLRINTAKDLLEHTDLSITEIFQQVGYNTRNPFIRSFKSLEGITPTEYRRMAKRHPHSLPGTRPA